MDPSGKPYGIEPQADSRYEEPSYDGGTAAIPGKADEQRGEGPPLYEGADKGKAVDEDTEETPPPPPNVSIVAVLMIIAIAAPPIGVITSIIWTILPSYRRAAAPALMASLVGGGIWGWVLWADIRGGMYEEPYSALQEYISAQDWARDNEGHYLSLLELRTAGYLHADFPTPSGVEFEIVEHVLGPTGYLVEISPGTEERRIYGMRSLWTDHTGDVRMDSRDGPRYRP